MRPFARDSAVEMVERTIAEDHTGLVSVSLVYGTGFAPVEDDFVDLLEVVRVRAQGEKFAGHSAAVEAEIVHAPEAIVAISHVCVASLGRQKQAPAPSRFHCTRLWRGL